MNKIRPDDIVYDHRVKEFYTVLSVDSYGYMICMDDDGNIHITTDEMVVLVSPDTPENRLQIQIKYS
jgi:hypothetical protein